MISASAHLNTCVNLSTCSQNKCVISSFFKRVFSFNFSYLVFVFLPFKSSGPRACPCPCCNFFFFTSFYCGEVLRPHLTGGLEECVAAGGLVRCGGSDLSGLSDALQTEWVMSSLSRHVSANFFVCRVIRCWVLSMVAVFKRVRFGLYKFKMFWGAKSSFQGLMFGSEELLAPFLHLSLSSLLCNFGLGL